MNIEWTHKEVQIKDIRKVRKFYVISIDDKKITSPLFVQHDIFEGRLNSYYLRGSGSISSKYDAGNITREEVLSVKWNMVINKGHFIKIVDGNEEPVYKDEDKFYISFLEISGPLGNHISNQ
jgi:hypothetical protein